MNEYDNILSVFSIDKNVRHLDNLVGSPYYYAVKFLIVAEFCLRYLNMRHSYSSGKISFDVKNCYLVIVPLL